MSHLNAGEVSINDLAALEAAAKTFGGTLVKKDHYNWFEKHVGDHPLPKGMTVADLGKCDYVIQLPCVRYEVGVIRQKDGTYTLGYDYYGYCDGPWDGKSTHHHDGHKLLQTYGNKMGTLMQQYNKAKSIAAAKRAGYFVQERKNPATGVIKLTLQKV